MAAIFCPLCESADISLFSTDHKREYSECGRCRLVFMKPGQRLDDAAEKERYDSHNNVESDGYKGFLSRVSAPLLERLAAAGTREGWKGLDFGCGPGPVLAEMMRSVPGHQVDLYDPYYVPDPSPLSLLGHYDYVLCTEAAEHFFQPMIEFRRMVAVLKPGGYLGVMTSFLLDSVKFSTWYYARDPTHCCFYRLDTLNYIAATLQLTAEIVHPANAVLFRKAPAVRP